jgi:pyruvate ferredoxin oxidoreductase beta subunit
MSKIYNLKREVEKPPRLTGGHRLCAGCGAGVVVSGVLRALNQEDRAVVVNATSCLEVSTFMYPYTAYMDSFIHSAFSLVYSSDAKSLPLLRKGAKHRYPQPV